MSRQFALGIISSVGAALAHAHRRDIVHADIKPRNIMITTAGEVRVLDFGFARDRPLDLHTAPGLHDAPATAPAYASVERVNGSDPHPSDDVYSLACVAYELLSGRHPFGGRSAPLARAHGRQPQRIPGLNGKQQQTLQRALLWTRGERRIDVVELLAGLGCGEAPTQLGPPEELAVPGGSRSRWRRIAFSFLLVLLMVAGGYFVWQYELLPKNLANVLPITPPFADRELQGEVAGTPAATEDQDKATEAVETPPLATIQPPTVAPVPQSQRPSTAPAAPSPAQSGASTTPAPAPAEEEPPASNARQTQSKDQPKEQTSRNRTEPTTAPGAAAPAASSSSDASRPVSIQFDKDSYVTSEGDGSVRLLIRRTGSTRREVSFTWNLRGNSAEAGSDYAGIGPGSERIPAGVREVSITIPLVQDSIKETTELFLVELQVNEPGVSLGERSSAAVIIVDDD